MTDKQLWDEDDIVLDERMFAFKYAVIYLASVNQNPKATPAAPGKVKEVAELFYEYLFV